jgi:hypothetical protein
VGLRTACPVVLRARFRAGGGRRRGTVIMLRALSDLGWRPLYRPPALLLLPARGRKTRQDPPAKSKVGRVKTPPAVDPAEFFVLTERYREYRQTVRALRCVWRKGRWRWESSREYWGDWGGRRVPT